MFVHTPMQSVACDKLHINCKVRLATSQPHEFRVEYVFRPRLEGCLENKDP